jgi:hypothetical protein
MEDPGIDGRIVLRWIFINSNGDMDLTDLVQNKDRRMALLCSVINFQFL